jgi:hypothetical protein
MFFGITKMMMVLSSLFKANTALEMLCPRKFAIEDSGIDATMRSFLQREGYSLYSATNTRKRMPLIGFIPSSFNKFASFGRAIQSLFFTITVLAGASKSVFCVFIVVKFRQWFCLIALRTGLCYDAFRHVRFLIKRICSGLVAGYTPASGPFIIQDYRGMAI